MIEPAEFPDIVSIIEASPPALKKSGFRYLVFGLPSDTLVWELCAAVVTRRGCKHIAGQVADSGLYDKVIGYAFFHNSFRSIFAYRKVYQ